MQRPLISMHGLSIARVTRHACLALALAAHAAPVTAVDRTHFHTAPPLGDDYLAWTKRQMRLMHPHDLGETSPFLADAEWADEYLSHPTSIYSGLHPRLFAAQPPGVPDDVGGFPGNKETARKIAWDLGLDKSLPGFQAGAATAAHEIKSGQYIAPIAANLAKAGVLPIYYEKAYSLSNGSGFSTIHAEIAVAVQILHDWIENTTWAEREAAGIDEGVLMQFMAVRTYNELTDRELTYLADILRGELSLWHAGRENGTQQRELPTPLRIARVAAAYKISQGPYRACYENGTHNPETAGYRADLASPVICFTDATDRAVYRWYRAERLRQFAQSPRDFSDFALASRLMNHFGDIRPMWAGAYAEKALDWSNHAEVVEAQMAATGAPEEGDDIAFLRLVERANLLVCRSSVP